MSKLKELINNSKYTQNELARRAGTSHVTIHNLRTGKANDITLSIAFRLADALEVDINEFREEE